MRSISGKSNASEAAHVLDGLMHHENSVELTTEGHVMAKRDAMKIDEGKIDDAVLALLYLTLDRDGRAWKGFDWAAMNRLHAKGLIVPPVTPSASLDHPKQIRIQSASSVSSMMIEFTSRRWRRSAIPAAKTS
jgi:Domain of unknown function (DUF6429)